MFNLSARILKAPYNAFVGVAVWSGGRSARFIYIARFLMEG